MQRGKISWIVRLALWIASIPSAAIVVISSGAIIGVYGLLSLIPVVAFWPAEAVYRRVGGIVGNAAVWIVAFLAGAVCAMAVAGLTGH
jgi:hypothetical protein